MTTKGRLILIAGLLMFVQQTVYSQENTSKHFLSQVGALDSIYSETLHEYRKIYVQLPEEYDNNLKYPVAYILDGEIFLPTVHNFQGYYGWGFTPKMILVGISNDNNRMRDLTTSKITEMYGMPFENENGEAANFSAFIETELIPYIEKNYPVTNYRTLIGHSYGGLFTLYSLVHHPQLYSNYVAIDPSMDWDNQRLIEEAKGIVSTTNYKGKSLFMSLGGTIHMQKPEMTLDEMKEDTTDFTIFARSNIAFSEVLNQNKKNGLAFEWKFYPRDLHGTIAFPSIMDGLISVFQWYQWENVQKFNSPTTSVEELAKSIRYRQNKLERYFGYPEPPYTEFILNMSGYMSMDNEQMKRAKMFFDFVIEFYPDSPNAYDSMADYYERNEDYANAIKYMKKAFELNNDDYYTERIEALKKKL